MELSFCRFFTLHAVDNGVASSRWGRDSNSDILQPELSEVDGSVPSGIYAFEVQLSCCMGLYSVLLSGSMFYLN